MGFLLSAFNVLCELIIFIVIVVFVKYNWDRRRLYLLSWRCNGPFAIPIGGNLLSISGPSKDLAPKFNWMFEKYKDPARLWIGPELFILIKTPEDCEVVLNNPLCLEKSDAYRKVLHEGLFSSPLSKWKRHRKILQPCFNQRFLNTFVEVFNTQSSVCVDQLEQFVGTHDFDLKRKIFLCFVDMLGETELGVDMKSQTRSVQLVDNIERGSRFFLMRVRHLLYNINLTYNLIGAAKIGQELRNEAFVICKEIIDERKKMILKKRDDSDDGLMWKALLDHLIEMDNVFTETEIIDHLIIFIVGGTDTGTVTICSTLMFISIYQEIQENMMNEMYDIFGDSDRPVTCEDLKNLQYMERVIKESMRLFPVSLNIGRKTTGEVKFSSVTVPADTSLMINIVHLHRNPKYWNDPLKFDPERFLPENVAKRHPYCYIPFSAGPRNCIGMVYGMMAMKVLLVRILRAYKLRNVLYKSVEDIQLDWQFLLTPVDGYGIIFEKRTQ